MTQLVVSRFFETPLIRALWALDRDPLEQAIALAEAHTADVTGVSRYRWHASVEEVAPAGFAYVPGAFWVVIVASEASVLIVEDPRLPMAAMHAPHLGFRALDLKAAEAGRVPVPLAKGAAAMIPGWLRHVCDRSVTRVALIAQITSA